MDGAHNDKFVASCYHAQVIDDLPTCRRVETAGGFVKEKNLWTGNELACDPDAAFLPARDTFPDWRANESVRLFSQTEGLKETINLTEALGTTNRPTFFSAG